jgi:hypothetical protein
LDANFSLSSIEEKFGLFPCDDQEKVAFAAHQLRDAAGVWWKSYKAQIARGHQITWDEFCQVFRAHHIPAIKREEFLKLTQGNRSMQEYAHAFNYLSQYAKDDVSIDEKKQYQFMKRLS